MKHTFNEMETSPSAENPADLGVRSDSQSPAAAEGPSTVGEPPLSKNKLKKLKRDQKWEENREQRKMRRKEKLQEKKQRKRIAREEAAGATRNAVEAVMDGSSRKPGEEKFQKHHHVVQVPITLVIDCGFDDLMVDSERKSLGSQLTRCYSDNYKAPYRTHLVVSSFGGYLKNRFESVLSGNHRSWKGVRFSEDDFAKVAGQAREWMKESKNTRIAGALATQESPHNVSTGSTDEGEVIYLTSDSPNTLTELRPYSTYIIGGIVDKNRHKGICYKRAMDQNIKTAKLPIGDFMQMTSRFVLATNHVAEIMLRWLEVGDWGRAFLQVIPKRKGGVLKDKVGDRNGRTGVAPSNASDLEEAAELADGTKASTVSAPNECKILCEP